MADAAFGDARAARAGRCGARLRARARRACLRCRLRRTATESCAMIGPASISGTTKCTVAPCRLTPASSARRWVCSPLNCGSSAGWMLSIRPLQRVTNHGVNSRMKPARQTRSIAVRCKLVVERAFERFAIVAERRVIDDRGRDAVLARAGQARLHRAGSKRRARFRPDSRCALAASISAVMFEPRPEMSTATRFLFMPCSPGEIEVSAKVDARCPSPATTSPSRTTVSPFAAKCSLAASAPPRIQHGDHADAAVERAQHFLLADVARCASHLNTGSTGTRSRSSATREPLRQHARECFR